MHRRKLEQIRTYSRIMKHKKTTGEVEEVRLGGTGLGRNTIGREQMDHNDKLVKEEDIDAPLEEEFEDEFEDEYQKQQAWVSDDSEEAEEVEDSGTMMPEDSKSKQEMIAEERKNKQVFLGSNKGLGRGEILEFDNHAYDMLHRLNTEWPSLSIDFICRCSPFDREPLKFEPMVKYPFEVYTVQGSSNESTDNSIYLTKWWKLHRTKYDDDPDEANEEETDDDEPQVVVQQFATRNDINRIRTLNNSPVIAFWSDRGKQGGAVHIADLTSNMDTLRNNYSTKKKEQCHQIILPTDCTGWAINWNPFKIGELLAGDDKGCISVYVNDESYTSWSKAAEYSYHESSVEDVIYSPQQSHVFASCSSDGTLQLVDMRIGSYKKSQLKIKAHQKDVNVCDWNKVAVHLIVTGSDDCTVKVWDLRMNKEGAEEELLCFNWHTEPITSIRFQPHDQSVLAVASDDNRLSIWDMSVENEEQDPQVPNELMFLHQGQQEIKEICYHPVYSEMLISSALDSINIFKPSFQLPADNSADNDDKEDLKKPPIKEEDLDKYLSRLSLG